MKQDPLAGLRDIHMPEAISWWPPAPGWWLLLLLALLLTAALYWWLKRRKAQTQKPKQFSSREMLKQASKELDRLESLASAGGDGREIASELSALLRRIAIGLHPADAEIAGLSGETWLNWLDGQWTRDAFTHGAGRSLLDAPYRRDGQFDISALLSLSRAWIKTQR